MPAGVIDISKYAMADRLRRVLVRMTAALPTATYKSTGSAILPHASSF